jgi:predicted glycosyltransferase
LRVPSFDISLTHFSGWAIFASQLRNKKVIAITDNDINPDNDKFLKFIDVLFSPSCIPSSYFIKKGLNAQSLVNFRGYKEDLYLADYSPDPFFLDNLPFKKFITIRPESIQATYNKNNRHSIVERLIDKFSKMNINILFLPRYKEDKNYVNNQKNIFVPSSPLNGLDICYYSDLVLTGAGTFSREAACMGRKAVSFFPGEKILTVDKKLISEGKIFHSRNPDEIISFYKNLNQTPYSINRSKLVQKIFLLQLSKALKEFF